MFKRVLLAGALLAPVLAYGGSPSTDLSVQIVPAASPTPPPPTTNPTPPAGAQVAKFTTLAFNQDFTGATTSEYNGNTFNAQNTSSWLDCAGAPSPLWYWADYRNNATPNICSRIFTLNDNGISVLDLQFQPGDTGTIADTMMQSSNINNTVNPMLFPSNLYFEIKERTTSNTLNSCPLSGGCIINDDWSWWGAVPGSNGAELDFMELAANSSGSSSAYSWMGYEGAGGMNYPNDYTNYHIYGVRMTTDASTGTIVCNYYDNVKQNCTPNMAGDYNARFYLIEMTGPQSLNGYSGSAPTQTQDHYIQWIRVWSCSSWATGPCSTTPTNQ